jgi:hypothetical protein
LEVSKPMVYHVRPDPDSPGLQVRLEGDDRREESTTKREADERARDLGRSADLGLVKVHDSHGEFETERTYGDDPVRSPG